MRKLQILIIIIRKIVNTHHNRTTVRGFGLRAVRTCGSCAPCPARRCGTEPGTVEHLLFYLLLFIAILLIILFIAILFIILFKQTLMYSSRDYTFQSPILIILQIILTLEVLNSLQ